MPDSRPLRNTEILGLGWSLGWRIAAGLLAGYYLDRWLATTPLLTLALSLAALVTGVRQMLAMLAPKPQSRTGPGGSVENSGDADS